MNQRILCCIFNYNKNAEASAWADRLSPFFDTVILDSGSDPRCPHPLAVPLDNLYYSGLMNEACRRGREGGYGWVMVVTSDLEISPKHTARLVAGMQDVARATNVGLYQPSTAWRGRSLPQSRCHWTGRLRRTNFQEGWFHLVRLDLLEKVCPIDVGLNKLGWGVDLALSHFARVSGLLVLVDDRVRVVHPGGTGYNKEEALRQMRAWHASIPGYTSPRHFRPSREAVRYSPSRLLVHLHVFYQDQVPYFLEKLSHINGCDWDLYVTLGEPAPEVERTILAFKPDAVILQVEKTGYDVWPFVRVLRAANLGRYHYVLKLHTKGVGKERPDHFGGVYFKEYRWRNMLVDSLLSSPAQFRKVLGVLENRPMIGLVCDGLLIRKRDPFLPEDNELLDQELARLGFRRPCNAFCAGTMFLARMAPFARLRDTYLEAESFGLQQQSHSFGSLAHVYERICSYVVTEAGYRLYPVAAWPLCYAVVKVQRACMKALKWVFQLAREGREGVKVLTVLGMRFPLNDKKPVL